MAFEEIRMGFQVGHDIVDRDDLDLPSRTVGRRDRAVAAPIGCPWCRSGSEDRLAGLGPVVEEGF